MGAGREERLHDEKVGSTYVGALHEREEVMKRALITGITGQDGSYLAEFLLAKGYVVHGIIRRASSFNTDRIDHLYEDQHEENVNLFLHYGELADATGLEAVPTVVEGS